MNSWSLVYDEYDPQQEKLREALCTVGNGYFCTRGAAPEACANEHHYPGTYLAGGYNRLQTEIAGRTIENEDLVNLPNWLPLCFRIDSGSWFDIDQVNLLDYRQELDLHTGILHRRFRFEDEAGRITRLEERRLVHMRYRHLAALETRLIPENWSGRLSVRSALDGRITNDGVERYRDLAGRHLEPVAADQIDDETIFLKMRTRQSRFEVALAARTRAWLDSAVHEMKPRLEQEEDFIAQSFEIPVSQDQEIRLEKTLALYTSRDEAIAEAGLEARNGVARSAGFEELLESHALRWDQ